MKSRREQHLDDELGRMRQRAFEERAKREFEEFTRAELLANAKNRLDPRWRKAWDLFHDQWQKWMLPKQNVSPLLLKKHDKERHRGR